MTADALFTEDLEPYLAKVDTPSDEWDRQVIDQCIKTFVDRRVPFSCNDIRPLLPEVRRSLIAPAILGWARRKRIEPIGKVRSTDPGTHGKELTLWRAMT